LDEHGLPLDAAQLLFDGPFIEEEDRRSDYGETRFIARVRWRSLLVASVLL